MPKLMPNNNYINCPICDSKDLLLVFGKESMPLYNLEIHKDKKSALNAKTGSVLFYFCNNCIFVFNVKFDSTQMDYNINYESSRGSSEYFNKYLDSVCHDIDRIFDISDKKIVEIGSGDGQFLKSLRKKYFFKGYGFDPSIIPNLDADLINKSCEMDINANLKFIKNYYVNGALDIVPDIFILRHILEHQKDPRTFFKKIFPNKTKNTFCIYIEVPAWEWIVDNNFIYAFSYEHCSYYSQYSLILALKQQGVNPKVISFTFNDEYLQYFGNNYSSSDTLKYVSKYTQEDIIENTKIFIKNIQSFRKQLDKRLSRILNEAVLWGAAGRGTTLLNFLDITKDKLEYVIDSNPLRHNTYIPRTAQQVVEPIFLKDLNPKYILITNYSYYNEIKSQIRELGLDASIISIEKLLNQEIINNSD